MSPTPQGTAADAVGIRSLSAPELALLWVERGRAKMDTKDILDEFTRRYWVEQEERAASGDLLRLVPAFRPLGHAGRCPRGVEPFAS